MKKILGFLALGFFTSLLFVSTLDNLWVNHKIFFVVLSFFLIGVIVSFVREFLALKPFNQSKVLLSKSLIYDFLAVFVGSIITYIVSIYGGLGAVVGSALVGVFAGLFVKPYAVAIFCGSFVGMASPDLLGWLPFIFASLMASSLFVLAKDSFNGFGGKLGTIALSSSLLIWVFIRPDFIEGSIFTQNQSFVIVVVAMIAALTTYVMNIKLNQGPVVASAFIGLLAGGFFPFIDPVFGTTLAVVGFGASFVGMSNTLRMPTMLGIMLAGILFGLIFVYSAPYFGGAGGKLGTIAFSSVLSVSGIRYLITTLFPQRTCVI